MKIIHITEKSIIITKRRYHTGAQVKLRNQLLFDQIRICNKDVGSFQSSLIYEYTENAVCTYGRRKHTPRKKGLS